jgi:cytochrome bd ubiquinol oxidase subunit I
VVWEGRAGDCSPYPDFGEKRLGRLAHWFAAFMVFAGSWLSGYFIVATDAWMQHPVAYLLGANGMFGLQSFWGLAGC